MMVRSRSSVPPITGTAIAIIRTQSEMATMMSMKAAPLASPKRRMRKGGRGSFIGRLVGLWRYGDERLELQKTLLADAFDVHQILEPLEAAGLGPVLDDSFGGLTSDAGQGLELIDCRGVEIDHGFGGSRSGGRRRRLRLQVGGKRRQCNQDCDADDERG